MDNRSLSSLATDSDYDPNSMPVDKAREYIRALEIVSEVPVVLVSTGSDRTHTIFREGTIADGWATNREAGV